MARIPKKPKREKGRQPRCWVCNKIATVAVNETHYEHWSAARFFPEYGTFRLVTVCSEECGAQVMAEGGTDAIADLERKVIRESPIAKAVTMLNLLAKSEGDG